MSNAAVIGVGGALPETVVASAAVEARLALPDGWIERRTGVRERHVAGHGDTPATLAIQAGAAALDDACLAADELDLVLLTTASRQVQAPDLAPAVAQGLGSSRAGALDIGGACVGAIAALDLASAQVDSGRADNVLVIATDAAAAWADPLDPRTAGIFGDGAGALVVGRGAASSIGPVVRGADAELGEAVGIGADGVLTMDGERVFEAAVDALSEVSVAAARAVSLSVHELDAYVFHQANGRILDAVRRKLDLDEKRIVRSGARHGNTGAASIPLALVAARSEGALPPGARVLLAACGAGFVWAATVIRWEGDPDV